MAPRAAPAAAGSWTVLCDFDGTISTEDVTDSLLLRFARPGWVELEARWRAGEIGSRECMSRQVALLDCSRAELDAHLAGMAIDPQFKTFAAAVQAAGVPLRIVSDGLDVAIRSILERHGIEGIEIFASRLVETGPRRWRLEFPHALGDCSSASATCKCALAAAPAPGPHRSVLMIGDGASDFCVASRADLTLARKDLLAHCAARGHPHLAVADFAQALAAWNHLTIDAAEASAPGRDKEALDARS